MRVIDVKMVSKHLLYEVVTMEITMAFFLKRIKKFLRSSHGEWYNSTIPKRRIVYTVDYDIAYDEYKVRKLYEPRKLD